MAVTISVPDKKERATHAKHWSLMEVLAVKRDAVIEKWMQRVRADEKIPSADDINKFILRDDMPGILRQLIVALGHHLSGTLEIDEAIVRAAKSESHDGHIHSRLEHGYQLPEALREYSHLRAAIIDVWIGETEPSRNELMIVHAAIDELMVKTATRMFPKPANNA